MLPFIRYEPVVTAYQDKKITGLSASEYIKRSRMKKAWRWIRSGKSISEVAYNVGYSAPNYLSKAFKKEF
ncbi:helix-turn-helix domain-containing protein [Sinomicrobium kalidii]|uniref:helix-turn-helix domain-containing protein n=1 Tax=Sinomicrobium kalidii TaxID=2900738 RepID=UPI002677000A|nr:AraC family transcriptional regulator [Sinomicrobium kalidii]